VRDQRAQPPRHEPGRRSDDERDGLRFGLQPSLRARAADGPRRSVHIHCPGPGRHHVGRWLQRLGCLSAFSGLYGDLVVGKYDASKMQVAWQSIDGLPPALPAGTCPQYDPTGWRQGQSDPGADVGLWTSIQVGASGKPDGELLRRHERSAEVRVVRRYDLDQPHRGGGRWERHRALQQDVDREWQPRHCLLGHGAGEHGEDPVEGEPRDRQRRGTRPR